MKRSFVIFMPFLTFYSVLYCKKCNSLRIDSINMPYLEPRYNPLIRYTDHLNNPGLVPLLSHKITVHNENFSKNSILGTLCLFMPVIMSNPRCPGNSSSPTLSWLCKSPFCLLPFSRSSLSLETPSLCPLQLMVHQQQTQLFFHLFLRESLNFWSHEYLYLP